MSNHEQSDHPPSMSEILRRASQPPEAPTQRVDTRRIFFYTEVSMFHLVGTYWEWVYSITYVENDANSRPFWIVELRRPSFEFLEELKGAAGQLRAPAPRLSS